MSALQFNSHSLVEIRPSEWKTLLDLYAQKRTESSGYNLINNYIKWIAQDPQLDIKCFSLDGDWKNDGTFLIIVNNGAALREVCFNTLSDNLERLTNALLCLTSEANAYLLYAYGERLIPAVAEYKKKFEKLNTNQTAWYTASKELVATFSTEPPAGIELRSLEIKDAPTINEVWPHHSPGSVEYIKLLIRHNVSVGAFYEQGKLLPWCLRQPIGALGLLQVLSTHKHLGLGSLMVRYLSRKISDLGDEVMAPVIAVA